MKNIRKQENGITLIALVVTIIVLLILAGISIAMLTGQNGILNRAAEAKEKTGVAQEDENQKLKGYEDTIKQYAPGSNGGSTGGGSTDGTPGEGKLPETAVGQPAGTAIKNPDSYGENPNAQATADGAGKYFAKPEGATYVEGTVDTGVVVNIKGSEFVWVPVEDVVLDTSKDANLPKSSDVGTTSGKTYTPMAVQVENDYKGILYEFSGGNGYLKYANNANYQGSDTEYREPDVVSYDTQESYKNYNITKDGLQGQYNSMIASVLKYKGFYVARYEAGLDNTTKKVVFKNAKTTSGVTTLSADSSNSNMWYGLYEKMASFAETNDKFVSSMIWGSQYDAMMNWMAKTGNTVEAADDTKRNTTTITGGGEKPDIINNIYDLYGCHFEWTLEAISSKYRANRGGFSDGNLSPARRSDNFPTSTPSGYSSRATLYIK
jgi:type II secretory pathway pseudopilin PulG